MDCVRRLLESHAFPRAKRASSSEPLINRKNPLVIRLMMTVCVFYASENLNTAARVVATLETRYKVVWDKDLGPGKFHEQMQPRIIDSDAALTLWSAHTLKSGCVAHSETLFARDHGVPVIHVRIDQIPLPMPFNNETKVDMVGWNGDAGHSRVPELMETLDHAIGSSEEYIYFRKRRIPLPCFFASVSSHETQLTPLAALQVINLLKVQTLLVSAYDMLYESESKGNLDQFMLHELQQARERGATVLLDSGNYESTRKRSPVSVWNADIFHRVLRDTSCDMAFCFDEPNDLQAVKSAEALIEITVSHVMRDRSAGSDAEILPIVHVPGSSDTGYNTGILPPAIRMIADRLHPALIAVPERELGNGIWQRVEMVASIRRELDTLGFYQPLHLLGTGNPWSLALFSLAGADSFDGLEWCRTSINRMDGRLYHYQHFDFFRSQSVFATNSNRKLIQVAVDAPDEEVGYNTKVALHNLDALVFEWMKELADARQHDHLRCHVLTRMKAQIPDDVAAKLAQIFPEVT